MRSKNKNYLIFFIVLLAVSITLFVKYFSSDFDAARLQKEIEHSFRLIRADVVNAGYTPLDRIPEIVEVDVTESDDDEYPYRISVSITSQYRRNSNNPDVGTYHLFINDEYSLKKPTKLFEVVVEGEVENEYSYMMVVNAIESAASYLGTE